jgi:hypothetical protein
MGWIALDIKGGFFLFLTQIENSKGTKTQPPQENMCNLRGIKKDCPFEV